MEVHHLWMTYYQKHGITMSYKEAFMKSYSQRAIIPEVKQYVLSGGVSTLKEKIHIQTQRLISAAIDDRLIKFHKERVKTKDVESTTIQILPMKHKNIRGSYIIVIGDSITIHTNDEEGSLYAFQTLLKYEHRYGNLEKGVITDYPSVEERGFHLDCGRKYFSPEWIINLIKVMSWHNMNMLQLHFSENKGFRLECTLYPEIVSDVFLNHRELKTIMDIADRYCIEIVPSFDSPGHLKHVLKTYPDFALPGSNGEAWDITNPNARNMIFKLYDYYAAIFQKSRIFNIGGDEFIDFESFDAFPSLTRYAREELNGNSGFDTYIHYLNSVAELLETKGFTVRVWNDGIDRINQKPITSLKDSIEVSYWTQYNQYMAPLSNFEEKDIPLINFHAENFYYVLHPEVGVKCIDPANWFELWEPALFASNQRLSKLELGRGVYYSLWCDEPDLQTEDAIIKDIELPMSAMAAKAWRKESTMTYPTFLKMIQKEHV